MSIRTIVEHWISRRRMLNDLGSVDATEMLIADLDREFEQQAAQPQIEDSAFHHFVHAAILKAYDDGLMDVIAFAMAGPDGTIAFRWYAPNRQNELLGAVSLMHAAFAQARLADMMNQHAKREGMN